MELVQPTSKGDYLPCRGGGHWICADTMTLDDRQAYNQYTSCVRCVSGTRTVTPHTSTPNSPTTMCNAMTELGQPTPDRSPSMTPSSGHSADPTYRNKRRRGMSDVLSPRRATQTAAPSTARPKPSPEVRKEKKEKEQESRNALKGPTQVLEILVVKHLGSHGMTELNQNNSRASGLKYKKVEVQRGAVEVISFLERQNADLRAQLKEAKSVARWSQSTSTTPTSSRGSRL